MNIRPAALALVLSLAMLSPPVIAGPAMTQSQTSNWKAQPTDWKKPNDSRQSQGWGQGNSGGPRANALLSGSENANRTNKLTSEINWHRSVGQAESVAAQQGKMILWVNLLGTMSGGT